MDGCFAGVSVFEVDRYNDGWLVDVCISWLYCLQSGHMG